MKKLAFSMAAMAFMLSANAADGDEEQNNTATEAAYDGEDLKPNGVYGGIGFTLTNNEWQQSTVAADWERWSGQGTDLEKVPGGEKLLGVDHTNNATRLSPVFFFGYGFLFRNFWIAPEVAVQLAPNVEASNSRSDIIDGSRRDSESWVRCNGVQPTLALKIGYYCARWNSVVYAKFGAVYKKFTFRDSEYYGDGWYVGEGVNYDDDNDIDSSHAIYFSNSKKFSNWRFLAGLGLSRALSKYVTVSGELTYTFGKKMKMSVEGACQALETVNGDIGDSMTLNGEAAAATDRMAHCLELNDKGTIGVGIYAQWNIWKPQSKAL